MIQRVIEGDCITEMKAMADSSVDLILADPPYYKVKKEPWDRQWNTPEGFLAWLGEVADEWVRVLKPNGSIYCFASPGMSARVECLLAERFNILNQIRWVKDAGWYKKTKKDELRAYLSPWEAIIFCEHYGADNMAKGEAGYGAECDELRGFIFEPLRAYLESERVRASVSRQECNEACGVATVASNHYFPVSQWQLPTAEHYAALRQRFNRDVSDGTEYLTRKYEDLRREYEDLRRPFSVTADVPYTDVWAFKTVQSYRGKHPCEKPLEMLEHIIRTSSRPEAVVLDPFAGSGNTALAAIRLGRSYIMIEKSPKYIARICERIHTFEGGPLLSGGKTDVGNATLHNRGQGTEGVQDVADASRL